jgi:hypothetical protein
MKHVFLTILSFFLISGVIPKAGDKDKHEAFANQKKFDCVGQILVNGNAIGSCVLIADRWVITAAHNLEDEEISTVSIVLLGRTYAIEKHFIHPKYQRKDIDLALIKLEEQVSNCAPAKLYIGTNELEKHCEIVGWGVYGTAYESTIDTNATKLGGTNVIEQIGGKIERLGISVDRHTILTDFESAELSQSNSISTMQPTKLEFSTNGGDSGGGLFIEDGGELFLAGIIKSTFFVFKMKIDSEKKIFYVDKQDFQKNGLFGSIDEFTRTSTNAKWIKSVIEKTD